MSPIRILWICFLASSLAVSASAKRDPQRHWQQTTTEHFLIIYPEAIAAQAAQAARIAEEAYPKVKGLFGFAPAGRIPIVLNDDVDMANGYSTGIYTKMEFYLASPTDKWEGTLHTSWLESLMYHEYAHLCHGLRAQGFTKVLTWIFGGVNAVNFISPQWWNEGVAEYSETVLTQGGRGRNPYHAMKLAANLLSEDPWSLGQLGTPPRYTFPSDRHYVGGYDLVKGLGEASQRPDFLDRATAQQSAFPFFGLGFVWRRSLKQRVNAVYDRVWHEKILEFTKQYGAERPATEGAVDWTQDPESQFDYPHWTARGGLAGLVRSLNSGPALVHVAQAGVRSETVARLPLLTGDVRYDARTATWYYARLVGHPIFSDTLHSDIFALDQDGERQVTHAGRAWSPDVAADGRLVCVQNRFGPTQLVLVEPGSGRMTPIPAAPSALYLSPRWSPDGTKLAAVVRISGKQDVCLVDLASGALTPLTGWDSAGDHDPAWAPDGQTLFFVSDRSRVFQVYAYRLDTQTLWQVTQSRMGVFHPEVSPDGQHMAVAEYRVGNHQQLVTFPLDPARWKPVTLPPANAQPEPPAETTAARPPHEEYQPWPHLLPTYWIPYAGEDQDGALAGALSARRDPLELHAWQAYVLVQPLNGKMYGDIEYHNDLSWFTLGGKIFSLPFYRWQKNVGQDDSEKQWARSEGVAGSAGLTWEWYKGETRLGYVQGTGEYAVYRLMGGDESAYRDTAFSGATAGLTAAYIRQSSRDMFPTAGVILEGEGRWATPGHAYDGQLAWAGARLIIPSPVEHQALKLGVVASTRRGTFPYSFTETQPLGYYDDERAHSAKVSAAYQAPVWYFDGGPDVFPLFIHGFWGEAGGEWGAALDPMSMEAWKEQARTSLNVRVHMDFEAFWYVPMRLTLTGTATQDQVFSYTLSLDSGM